MTNELDFLSFYQELSRINEDGLLQKSKKGNGKPKQLNRTRDPRLDVLIPVDEATFQAAQRKVVMTPQCAQDLKNASATLRARGLNKLAQLLPQLSKKQLTLGSDTLEKVKDLDFTVFELKLGYSRDNKPTRYFVFIHTAEDGTPYLILARFFQHTQQRLTKKERAMAEAQYYKYIG